MSPNPQIEKQTLPLGPVRGFTSPARLRGNSPAIPDGRSSHKRKHTQEPHQGPNTRNLPTSISVCDAQSSKRQKMTPESDKGPGPSARPDAPAPVSRRDEHTKKQEVTSQLVQGTDLDTPSVSSPTSSSSSASSSASPSTLATSPARSTSPKVTSQVDQDTDSDTPSLSSSLSPSPAPSTPPTTSDTYYREPTMPPSLLVKTHSEKARVPTRGSPKAAGYDLYSAEKKCIPARGKAVINTQISIGVPPGTYGRVAPRSGLAAKFGIDTGAGVIDEDYTGILHILLFNLGENEFLVNEGDRIAQLIIERIFTPEIAVVDELKATLRGSGGFGSTGGHCAL